MIGNFIRFCSSILKSQSGGYDTAKIDDGTNTTDAVLIQPYGVNGYAKKGSLGIVLNVKGQSDNKVVFLTSMPDYSKTLKEGEFETGNFIKGNVIFFDDEGKIHIKAQSDVVIDSPTQIIATAPKIITNGEVEINGKTDINGDLKTVGNVDLDGGGQGVARIGDLVDFNPASPTYMQILQGSSTVKAGG